MTLQEIYNKLLSAKRPFDFFGDVTLEELKKAFRTYAKKIHPDTASNADKYIAGEAFSLLNELHSKALEEFENGIYGVVDPIEIYKHSTPLFGIDVKGKSYNFYENVFEGEVATVFKGTTTDEVVFLKIASDSMDNALIDTEYDTLLKLRHQSLPYVLEKITINSCQAIIMREVAGISMDELVGQYSRGVPPQHVMWMLERLLSVTGFLHSNLVVHGNIKPENVIINKANHNVSLLGFSFCIPNANVEDAHYKIINDDYTAPEVSKTSRVLPSSDIYSIGKIAIKLLGGNVENTGMPISVDARVRSFIREMVNPDVSKRPTDAWQLWSKLQALRTEVYGDKRFQKLS